MLFFTHKNRLTKKNQEIFRKFYIFFVTSFGRLLSSFHRREEKSSKYRDIIDLNIKQTLFLYCHEMCFLRELENYKPRYSTRNDNNKKKTMLLIQKSIKPKLKIKIILIIINPQK